MDILKFFCCLSALFCLTSAKGYRIHQNAPAVLNRKLILTITTPDMKRPVVWKCGYYKYQCNMICADGPNYKVRHTGDTAILWIRKITKNCSTWKFEDGNHNVGKIDLEIKSLSRAQKYKITQSGPAVLNGNLTLSITIPNMKRPVVWKCHNYKYECDRTCADGHDYKVTHLGDTSTLWIKKVTKKCSTWKFEDDNLNIGRINLKIKSFSSANIYKITQSGIAVLNGCLTLSITIPNMKRPVVWKCDNYKYECDRTCADGPDYKVTQDGNTSTLWIKKVTKECSTWKFDDDNLNAADIDLKIKSFSSANIYKITQSGIAVLNGCLTLSITIPDMKRPVVWKCDNYKYECDKTCPDGPDYKVTQDGNTSTLWIKKVTKECSTWKFDDDNLNVGKINLEIKNLSRAQKYNITQSGPAVLNGNLTLSITIPNMKRPVVWKCDNYKYECDRTCANGTDYKVTHSGDTSKLWIRKVTEKCSTWKFEDDNLNIGRIDLEIKKYQRTLASEEFYCRSVINVYHILKTMSHRTGYKNPVYVN
ncbi:uncharacterized protein LOC115225115 isoform X4 [Octopus sinensis]|uniref:Uncharacterized protein LOC115225115 isoform X4 n=1 Tax=Octopus sinensis TaxID=2607531 RepID=A0A7E6FQV0_9MOLL|nr:uncharacterized protein LOC115225115 isoform X4 [Octopus sinensis]